MANSWRQFGKAVVRRGKQVLPLLVSAGLVTWLIWSVTPQKLAQALASLDWPWLVLATAVQVVVLATWDTVTLWWLFSLPDRPLSFRLVLRARADSLLWSAINLEIGQGVFAWAVAQARHESLLAALGRCFLLALFDFGTLQSLALIGSFLWPDPLIRKLRWMCIGVVIGYAVLAAAARFLPDRWRHWLAGQAWASWIAWWNWRHSLWLFLQRLVLFLLVLVYVGVGLAICRVPVSARIIVGAIPFVLLAESLPGTGGLGERETALIYLLKPVEEQRAVLLSFGLIWSTGVILGRMLIGLVSWYLPRAAGLEAKGPSEREPARVGSTADRDQNRAEGNVPGPGRRGQPAAPAAAEETGAASNRESRPAADR